jgi:lincosamide nucleotidyltransferase A/C/D/E
MNPEAVVEALTMLERKGVRVWLDGGWGVDALLCEQTRSHSDLDLILNAADVTKLKDALLPIGYRLKAGGAATHLVLENDLGNQIDVHPIDFDSRGFGIFNLGDGRRWPFPPGAFAGMGQVMGCSVRCLSPDAQVQCHAQGYVPTEKDLRDMELLQQRFGVVLPVTLCRQGSHRDAL